MTRTLELLERLVAFPTVSHLSNLDLIKWARTLLEDLGFRVSVIPSENGEKAGLHARIGPNGDGGICLSGHTDVVPAAGQNWTYDPFQLTRSTTHVFGRGVTDMKGFLASALSLAERASKAELKKPLSLVLSYDEEVGCIGIRDMLPTLTPLMGRPDLVVVGEPTSMQVAIGHKGKSALKVLCKGEPGHSALAPEFVNAIHVASAFVVEMRDLQRELSNAARDPAYDVPYSTVHVGKIEGGCALNVVPDLVTLEMEFRNLHETPDHEIMEAIATAARRVEGAFGRELLIEIEKTNNYPGLNQETASDHVAMARTLVGCADTKKVPFGTEAGYFAHLGHNVLVVGPGDMASDGHKPDEALEIAQLDACDAMMNRILSALTVGYSSGPL